MGQPNLLDLSLSEEDAAAVENAVTTLVNVLQPNLKQISNEDKRELPKMGERTVGFVEKAKEYAELNPDLVPSFLDLDEFSRDLDAVKKLSSLERRLQPVMDALNDSLIIVGSEAYQAGLIFYRNVRNAKAANVQSALTIYDDLSTRFPGAKNSGNE